MQVENMNVGYACVSIFFLNIRLYVFILTYRLRNPKYITVETTTKAPTT